MALLSEGDEGASTSPWPDGRPSSRHDPDWGPTTLFTQGRFEPDAEQLAHLDARGVTIERQPVVGLLGDPGHQTRSLRAFGRWRLPH